MDALKQIMTKELALVQGFLFLFLFISISQKEINFINYNKDLLEQESRI